MVGGAAVSKRWHAEDDRVVPMVQRVDADDWLRSRAVAEITGPLSHRSFEPTLDFRRRNIACNYDLRSGRNRKSCCWLPDNFNGCTANMPDTFVLGQSKSLAQVAVSRRGT